LRHHRKRKSGITGKMIRSGTHYTKESSPHSFWRSILDNRFKYVSGLKKTTPRNFWIAFCLPES